MVIRIENKRRKESGMRLLSMKRKMTTVRKISMKKRIVISFPHHLALLETLLSPPSLSRFEAEPINLRNKE